MQENIRIGPNGSHPWDLMPGQSLAALLALVGTRSLDVGALRDRTRLSPYAFATLLDSLQDEYLVDVVTSLKGDHVEEKVELTEKGESTLVSLLERTCELPEFR